MSNNDYTLTLILLALVGGPSAAIGGAIGLALPWWIMLPVGLLIGLIALAVWIGVRWDQRQARLANARAWKRATADYQRYLRWVNDESDDPELDRLSGRLHRPWQS